jgi:hypothetical protein
MAAQRFEDYQLINISISDYNRTVQDVACVNELLRQGYVLVGSGAAGISGCGVPVFCQALAKPVGGTDVERLEAQIGNLRADVNCIVHHLSLKEA